MTREEIKLDGREPISVYRIDNDVNGNPRYIIHYLALGLRDHVSTKKTREAGLRIYHGRLFGGGFTFTSYNIESSVKWIVGALER
jgi:hypothetical protein